MQALLDQLNHQPTALTADEIEYPEHALAYIFYKVPLHVARANIKSFYEAWVIQHASTAHADDTTEMLAFVNYLISIVDLSFVLMYKNEEVEKTMALTDKGSV